MQREAPQWWGGEIARWQPYPTQREYPIETEASLTAPGNISLQRQIECLLNQNMLRDWSLIRDKYIETKKKN